MVIISPSFHSNFILFSCNSNAISQGARGGKIFVVILVDLNNLFFPKPVTVTHKTKKRRIIPVPFTFGGRQTKRLKITKKSLSSNLRSLSTEEDSEDG